MYLGKRLIDIITVPKIYDFAYTDIIQIAQTTDVIWFNKRNMPSSIFEIEHLTDIYNSLRKFIDLQDFNTNFYIVADEARRKEFEKKLSSSSVSDIKNRIKFWSYNNVAELHAKTSELISIETKLSITH